MSGMIRCGYTKEICYDPASLQHHQTDRRLHPGPPRRLCGRLHVLRPILLAATLASTPVLAGPATVLDTQFRQAGGNWTISVTVAHADTGWEHYADGWEVLAPDGQRLGYRELFHPMSTNSRSPDRSPAL